MNGSILIVDDEQIIRGMLQAELEDNFNVTTSKNAGEALAICKENKFDLVISDINMPGMKGYELLSEIKRLYPKTKTALITAYNVDDYVRLAKEHGVSNIIPKTTPFNFDELNTLVKGLITEDIFGIGRHMREGFEIVKKYLLKRSAELSEIEGDIMKQVASFHRKEKLLRILLEEIISNAVYHAPTDLGGDEKYEKHSDIVLQPYEYVDIVLVKDDEKYGISVTDQSGRLTKETVFYKLDRNIHKEGLLDENGRGIYMSRLYADRLIININPKVKTEVIFLNYFTDKYKGFKPIYINEL